MRRPCRCRSAGGNNAGACAPPGRAHGEPIDLFIALWPLLLVAHVPALVNGIVCVLTSRVWHRHDSEIPDDLPQTAGAWLHTRLDTLGLPYRALTSRRHPNHCDPRRRLIVLASETSFKPDPVYWAIAAHELGHARAPAWFRDLATGATLVRAAAVAVATAFACAGVLYDLPVAKAVALVVFAAAIATKAVSLVDEAYASITAQRELRAAGLDARRLRASRSALCWAFATHLSTFVVELALLAWWPLAGMDLSRAPSTLTGLGTVVAVAATGLILLRLVMPARWFMHAPRLVTAIDMLAAAAPLVFLVLAWDSAIAIGSPWLVVLALVAAARVVRLGLSLPLGVPMLYVGRLFRYLTRSIVPSAEYIEARAAGHRQLGRDEATIAVAETPPLPRPVELAAAAVRLLPLPLVVAFWLA